MFNRIQPFLEGAGDKSCMCAHRQASQIVPGMPMENQWGSVHVAKNISPADEAGMWYPENAETSEKQHAAHEAMETPEEERREHAGTY